MNNKIRSAPLGARTDYDPSEIRLTHTCKPRMNRNIVTQNMYVHTNI